jgi:hypothetical protein
MEADLAFSLTILFVILVGGITALKYADYEQRKRHGRV